MADEVSPRCRDAAAPPRHELGSPQQLVHQSNDIYGTRLNTRVLQPAVSVLVPIDRTLFGAVDNFWAVRLSVQAVFEKK